MTRAVRLRRLWPLAAAAAAVTLWVSPVAAQEDGGDTTPSTEAPVTTEAPPTTEAPVTTEAPPTTEAPVTTEAPPDTDSGGDGIVDRVEGEGGDILIVLGVGIGGLIVLGLIISAVRRSTARRNEWRARALGAYREGMWVHDTLVPGRFGSGLEARTMLAEVRRRIGELGASLSALEVEAPNRARQPVAAVRSASESLLVAYESDMAVRTSAPGPTHDHDLQIASSTAAQRRAELAAALEALRATF